MSKDMLPVERIEGRIFVLRGQKVMFDRDLALLYGVETRVLNQAVKRNLARFPEDFMLRLTSEEFKNWISQFVISNSERMGLRQPPFVFTELGVAMLSSVLKSERAIMVNAQIIRTFTKLRHMVADHELPRMKLETIEKRYDGQFAAVFDALRQLLDEDAKDAPEIGFEMGEQA